MANRREEERERLRQARQERESSQAKSEKRRLLFVYVGAGLIGLVVLAGIVALVAGSGGSSGGEAHINLASGSTNGVEPDEREGTAPPAAQELSAKDAAKKAGCVLKLELKDEGHEHISPSAPRPTTRPTRRPRANTPNPPTRRPTARTAKCRTKSSSST